MNELQKQAGTTLYVEVYQKVHLKIQELRKERREKRIVRNVTDPKLRAIQRLKKNGLKQASRKRKGEEFENNKLRYGNTKKLR
jgi:U3 small nucleolar RNA-associated protein 20